MIVICEICGHHLGTTTRDRLRLPLEAAMFDAPEAGYPPPFLDGADWEWMRCPMCNKRPFIREDAITTTDGVVELAEEMPEPDAVSERIAELHAQGLRPAEIGTEVGMTHQAVKKRLKTMGL